MAEESVITDEIRNMIGVIGQPATIEIEKGMIKRLARAIGDDNPQWNDEGYARRTGYKGMIGPPALAFTAMLAAPGSTGFPDDVPHPHVPNRLDGGMECEFYEPMKPGDIITVTRQLTDAYERSGKSGMMLFLVHESSLVNQNGHTVCKIRSTMICT